ncbi:polysaccharide deacetylase family protein [candidate division KSB1 bacterium]|nr:polysaccharide deacetylase family protein [candidate division KSB1 bacterium]
MILQKMVLILTTVLFICLAFGKNDSVKTWGERLGFPKDKKVLILHADDLGMCPEANEAGEQMFSKNEIQSGSIMMPCPAADEFIEWYKNNPKKDIGIHLTLTSEWKEYRWGPVANHAEVPGLIDPDGYFWHEVPGVVQHATADEVEKEIRAQIDKGISAGVEPGHIDTHMGTLYGSVEFAKVYMKVAMEYNIPAMVIEFSGEVLKRFRAQGYPITDEMVTFASDYSLPKLDDFRAAPEGKSYEEKKQAFFELVKSLKPGITEIIFHPSVESDNLKSITNSWQQRVWESQMFGDPEVIQFFKDEGVMFTNWKDMMERFKKTN